MAPAFVCSPFSANHSRSNSLHHPLRCPILRPSVRTARSRYALQSCATPTAAKKTGLVVVDHGSKRKAANDMIFRIADDVRSRTPDSVPVFAAHMELAEPSIADAVQQCADSGVEHVVIVPFFLSPGRHATEDIPQLTEDAVNKFPQMTFDVKPPIGTHPSIIDVVLERADLDASPTVV